MTPFDLLHTSLEEGTSLIEASAGTGKTHTIAGLFLRLLVEKQVRQRPIEVDQLLVVTYTDAATEELRDRIRQLLAAAVRAFETGQSGDPLLQELLRRHAASRAQVHQRLTLSLSCFDLAPILTIHSFCQRALKDRAFESGSLFDTEVLADQSGLMREIAEDYWRRTFYAASPVRIAFALSRGLGPARLLPLLKSCLGHPRLRFVSRAGDDAAEEVAARLEETFAEARSLWRRDRAAITACFGSDRKWGNRPYNHSGAMAAWFDQLDRAFADTGPEPAALGALRIFSSSAIQAGVNKAKRKEKEPPPTHPFLEKCEQLMALSADHGTALQRDFFQFAVSELRLRKEKLKLLSYDDLITRLSEALSGPGGESLAVELRRRYQAALIDEFQDTDPVQYEIFHRLFAHPGGLLFLIGDPKQAIYGFRGADLFTYMKAARQSGRSFTLGENWRSESGLVHAINTVFAQAPEPFVFAPIGFDRVEARGSADTEPFTLEGRRPAPLTVWFCPRTDKPIPRQQAERELPQAVASEIARLLNGEARLGARRLRPRDFAVLVMTHSQARLVQRALNARSIPSVQQTQESVFESEEARELFRLLAGILQPDDERALRSALATRLLGGTGNELHALQTDEAAWQRRHAEFKDYFDLWAGRGFTPMFRQVLEQEKVRPRLVAQPEGERALTNVLHLAEILHEAVTREKLGPSALGRWFASRLADPDSSAEEHQLRLERDDDAVQLVTVHKSKGLQYEIVFAPFCWRGSDLKTPRARAEDQEVLFHDEDTGELWRALGPDFDPDHVERAKRERLAEQVRLLYVALTRARHRCYLAWGALSGAENSAPAWIFHRRGRPAPAPGEPWDLDFATCPDSRLLEDLETLAGLSRANGQPMIEVTPMPDASPEHYRPPAEVMAPLEVRRVLRPIGRDWRVTSFSGLAAGQREEAPDRDPLPAPATSELRPPVASMSFAAFPAGTKAGTCLHEILEQHDFTSPGRGELEELVERKLREHGFAAAQWKGVIAEAVDRTLRVPLDPGRPGFTLARVARADRLDEVEFCFPIQRLTPELLRSVFSGWQPGFAVPENWLDRLGFAPAAGYLKGFIDLVFQFDGRFYLVDWKSNRLGESAADYEPEALAREMMEELYVLQYHLYTVALHRYLALRQPGYEYERHFGGVRYLFLRGLDPLHPASGVFADRPALTLIEDLSRRLGQLAEERP